MTLQFPAAPAASRLSSTIAGLDRVLGGGFVAGSVYLFAGPPGAGKTILTNQVCFGHAATGGTALYITLLAETHTRLLAQLRQFAFYDPRVIGTRLQYFSAFTQLDTEGLPGLLAFLRAIVHDHRPTLLVVDGVTPILEAAGSELAFKHFLHEFGAVAETLGTTSLLIAQAEHPGPRAEYTMMDGVVQLRDLTVDGRAIRELQVLKHRGGPELRGVHGFAITDAGVTVYPRVEALYATPTFPAPDQRRLSLGVSRLDTMLSGGVVAATSTLLLGTPGSGKTALGLQFLAAGVPSEEAGLYFGFFEPPPRLMEKGVRLGLTSEAFSTDGRVAILWQTPLQSQLDELADRLLTGVKQHSATRLVIDGLEGFQLAATEPTRLEGFLTALMHELQGRGVTTLITANLRGWAGPAIEAPLSGLAPLVDNVLFLRHVELYSQLHRLVSVLKQRDSSYDSSIREFVINDAGFTVAETFASAEAVLTGIARPLRSATEGTAGAAATGPF
jgi:circadian clock protein KaiC